MDAGNVARIKNSFMKDIFYYREETTQGVAFLKSEIRCSISSKKVLCYTEKKSRATLEYTLKKVWLVVKTIFEVIGYIVSLITFIGFIASLFC